MIVDESLSTPHGTRGNQSLMVNHSKRNATAIPIVNQAGSIIGSMRPIGHVDADDDHLVENLTSWRNANGQFFLTRFEATTSRTSSWLRNQVLADDTRAFCLICSDDGTAIGHLGVRGLGGNAPELDNMIRGRDGGDPQLMYFAEIAMIRWLFRQPGVEKVTLGVFSNNWIPISLHQSIGFKSREWLPLYRHERADEIHFSTDPNATAEKQKFKYLIMELARVDFEDFCTRTFPRA
jgi:RimJ/RimL family protein N-acetyltransferase